MIAKPLVLKHYYYWLVLDNSDKRHQTLQDLASKGATRQRQQSKKHITNGFGDQSEGPHWGSLPSPIRLKQGPDDP